MIIGVTGKSGCGKNHYAENLCKNDPDYVHIDIDKIGHEVIAMPEVEKEAYEVFGDEVFTDGKIDRKKMGELVFNCREAYSKMAAFTWSFMLDKIEAILAEHSNVVINWILLPQTPYFEKCDIRYLFKADANVRAKRAMKRDQITRAEFDLRDSNSIEYDDYEFSAVFDTTKARGRRND